MWCCFHFRSTCSHVTGSVEPHIGHVIVSWHFPCIDRVLVLEDMFFGSQLCFCLSKIYLIAHYLFYRLRHTDTMLLMIRGFELEVHPSVEPMVDSSLKTYEFKPPTYKKFINETNVYVLTPGVDSSHHV